MPVRKLSLFTVLSVFLIYPLPQMAVDIYLPSLPYMQHDFQASPGMMQFTLVVYLFFLGMSQIIYGPLSDKFGRKKILQLGFFIFCIGCFLSAISHSTLSIIFSRVIQGLGMGCSFALASSIFSDIYEGRKLAKMMSFASMAYSLSAILAPVLGSYIQKKLGWRINFYTLLLYSACLFGYLSIYLPETNTNRSRYTLSMRGLGAGYFSLLTNLHFMARALCMTFSFGFIIVLNLVAPFVLQNELHVEVITYGQLLLIIGLSYFLGTMINAQALEKIALNKLIFAGLFIIFIASLGFLIASYYMLSTLTVIFFSCIIMFGIGFIYPNNFAKALEAHENKGFASAGIGSIGLLGVSLIGIIIEKLDIITGKQLAFSFIILWGFLFLTHALSCRKERILKKFGE